MPVRLSVRNTSCPLHIFYTPGAPPLTAADLWFFNAQNAIFSHFFLRSLGSRWIFSTILIEIWPKQAKMTFISTYNTFTWFSTPPLDKVHAPLRSIPGSATDVGTIMGSLCRVRPTVGRSVRPSTSIIVFALYILYQLRDFLQTWLQWVLSILPCPKYMQY